MDLEEELSTVLEAISVLRRLCMYAKLAANHTGHTIRLARAVCGESVSLSAPHVSARAPSLPAARSTWLVLALLRYANEWAPR